MNRSPIRPLHLLAVLLPAITLLASCATTRPAPPRAEAYDPAESVNRHIYGFNRGLDRAVLKPAADAYTKVTPFPLRTAVANFFGNIGYLNVVLNDLLQGKVQQGFSDLGRIVVNSTFGILGTIDVATPMGLARHDEDFGQTLAVWGVREGAYLTLPLFGPNTVRDSPGLAVSSVTNLLFYVGTSGVTIPLTVLNAVDQRARASGAFQFIDEASVDPYVFTREAYRQRRTFLIFDGNPPPPEFEDETAPSPETPPAER